MARRFIALYIPVIVLINVLFVFYYVKLKEKSCVSCMRSRSLADEETVTTALSRPDSPAVGDNERVKKFHIRKYSEIMSKCKSECVNGKGDTPIPKSVFFVKTDPEWTYEEWIALMSAHVHIKPDVIYIVTPSKMNLNCWWNRTLVVPEVSHVIVDASKWLREIKGMKFVEPAHVCDYMKITLLHEMGGILMDTDAIAIKSFDPLLKHQAVLARDRARYVVNGLMISQKHSCFMCDFAIKSYNKYNGKWNLHTTYVLNPISAWSGYKDVLILNQYDGFFPFTPRDASGLQEFLDNDKAELQHNVSNLYAIHLYHNLLNKSFHALKEQSIDLYDWLRESKSFGAEVFRSVLPSDFTEEHFNTSKHCLPLGY